MTLKEERLLENFETRSLFGYDQCDFDHFPEKLCETFANFLPVFRNIYVVRDDIGLFVREEAKEKGLLIQSCRMLI